MSFPEVLQQVPRRGEYAELHPTHPEEPLSQGFWVAEASEWGEIGGLLTRPTIAVFEYRWAHYSPAPSGGYKLDSFSVHTRHVRRGVPTRKTLTRLGQGKPI